MTAASFLLRARLLARRIDPLAALVLVLVLAGAVAQLFLMPARLELDARLEAARAAARAPMPPRPAPVAAPPSSDQNLALFQATLGERRSVDRQLKDVFALAARHGLALQQGEYRSARDRNAGVLTYQVNLPVRGSPDAIWQFAMDVLRALPHAALDDVTFRRDSVNDAAVEARLRLTLYLKPGDAR